MKRRLVDSTYIIMVKTSWHIIIVFFSEMSFPRIDRLVHSDGGPLLIQFISDACVSSRKKDKHIFLLYLFGKCPYNNIYQELEMHLNMFVSLNNPSKYHPYQFMAKNVNQRLFFLIRFWLVSGLLFTPVGLDANFQGTALSRQAVKKKPYRSMLIPEKKLTCLPSREHQGTNSHIPPFKREVRSIIHSWAPAQMGICDIVPRSL